MRAVAATFLVLSLSCSTFDSGAGPLPVLWSAPEHVTDDPGFLLRGATSPEYYFAVAPHPQLIALRRADGRLAWRAPAGSCDPPVYAAGRVFCPAGALHAFDAADGRRLWTADVGASFSLVQGAADADRVYAGTVFDAGTRSEAFAFDAATGAVRWRRSFEGEGWIGTRLRAFVFSPEGDLLVSLDALFPPQHSIYSAAVVVAVDPATGEERWRYSDGGPTTDRQVGEVVAWDDLFLYADGHAQEAVAVERASRRVRWRAPTTPGYLVFQRAPLVADGVAYFSDGGGGAFAVDAATGQRRWAVSQPGGARSHEVCGRYFLVHKGPVEVLDRASGRSLGWLLDRDDWAGQVAVADGVAYVSAESGVYAFDCRR